MDYRQYVESRKDEILDMLERLCRIPSVFVRYEPDAVAPFGEGIGEALDTMLEIGAADGFRTKNVKGHAGHIEWGRGEELLGILCHLDVVPAEAGQWSTPPFEPRIRDGKLYARGAIDDKGPAIAAYFAMRLLRELGVEPRRRVRLVLGTDEETAWRGITEYFKHEEMPAEGFSPDANFPLIHGEKGIMMMDFVGVRSEGPLESFHAGERPNVVPGEATVRLSIDLADEFRRFLSERGLDGDTDGRSYHVKGRSVHAMAPWKGTNAALEMVRFLSSHIQNPLIDFLKQRFVDGLRGEQLGIDHDDPETGCVSVNVGTVHYDEDGSKIGVNIRYPRGFDTETAFARLDQAASAHGLTRRMNVDLPLHYVSKDDPLVRTLMDAYQFISGDRRNGPFTIGGGTYSRALRKGVAFGMVMPGREEVAHQVDEHVHIEDLLEATAIYMHALHALLSGGDSSR